MIPQIPKTGALAVPCNHMGVTNARANQPYLKSPQIPKGKKDKEILLTYLQGTRDRQERYSHEGRKNI